MRPNVAQTEGSCGEVKNPALEEKLLHHGPESCTGSLEAGRGALTEGQMGSPNETVQAYTGNHVGLKLPRIAAERIEPRYLVPNGLVIAKNMFAKREIVVELFEDEEAEELEKCLAEQQRLKELEAAEKKTRHRETGSPWQGLFRGTIFHA